MTGGLDGAPGASSPEGSRFGAVVRHLDEVGSTNDELAEWARAGAPHGAVVRADMQFRGRGRQGRGWHSPRGGMYASLLLRPPAAAMPGIASFSVVTALVVAEVAAAAGRCRPLLKWPNDVWVDQRKLAGILLESRSAHPPAVVVGIGLNLLPLPVSGPGDPSLPAASLAEWGDTRGVDEVLAALLRRLEPAYARFLVDGFAPFAPAWRERSLLDGRWIEVDEGGSRYRALVEAVDDAGRLQVRTAEGASRALLSGEVHLLVEGSR